MKMFLTRLGENSRMVVTGDPSQVDLPKGQPSGLRDVVELLPAMDQVALVRFTNVDVMRHSLVTRIVRAYEARDRTDDSEHEPGAPT
jgi:phosphate starvation-inducible PhoH-like protein